MSDQFLKHKNIQGQTLKNRDGYLALLFGIGACLLLLVCINSTADFDNKKNLIFYPLVLLSHSPSFSTLFGLSALIILAGSAMFAAWRRANVIVVIFACLIGVGLLGGAFILSLFFVPNITPQQTLMHQGKTYHLATVWDGTVGIDSPIIFYMVFQCDEPGWLCRLYARPYAADSYLYRSKENIESEKFYPSDELFIDADQILRLRVEDEVYLVNSNSDFSK